MLRKEARNRKERKPEGNSSSFARKNWKRKRGREAIEAWKLKTKDETERGNQGKNRNKMKRELKTV